MISYFVNAAEALIAAYVLNHLCNIHKRSFFVLTAIVTFIMEYLGDMLALNDLPLLFAYITSWMILVLIFNRKDILKNFFMVLANNLIIDVGAIIAILLFMNVNLTLMMIVAKVIQLILSVGLVSYYKRFSYLKPKYWMPIISSLVLALVLVDMIMNQHFEESTTQLITVSPFIVLGIIILTLYTLFLFEESNTEIERTTLENSNLKSQAVTYDLINHTSNELNVLKHELLYDMMLVKQHLEDNNYDLAEATASSYIDRVIRTNHVFTTNNPVFDVLLSLKINDTSNITPIINIPYDDFYNRIEFLNLIFSFLDIRNDQEEVTMIIKESQGQALLQFTGNYEFKHIEDYERIHQQYSHMIMSYELSTSSEFSLMSIKINKRYYEEI